MNGRHYIARAAQRAQRGAALLTVLIALMIISIVLLEFQYSAMLERKLAYNDLNQLQAYYLAKSGIRVGLLRVALYGRARKDPQLKNMAQGMDIKPYLELIWSLPLPAFPPEGGREAMSKLIKEDKDAAEKQLEQTKVTDGTFTSVITTEASKINLNYLASADIGQSTDTRNFFNPPAKNLTQHVAILLANLLENFLRESQDPGNEYGPMRPEEVVGDIIDWVNPGGNRFFGGGKDTYYQGLVPPYQAKRNRLYSMEELRLVKGIDDHLYNKLKPYVTVYSYDGKININTASHDIMKAIYRDFTDDDLKRIDEEKGKRGGMWAKEQDFVDYVTQVLGRGGFTQLYPDANQYPFTVASTSFLIESLGVMKKSKSQVQRMIRVGVALAGANTNPPPGTDQPNCMKNPLWYWDSRFSPAVCKSKPTTETQCKDILAGRWDASTKCCYLTNLPPLCPAAPTTPPAGGSGSGTGGTSTPAAQPEPGTVRILYWSET